ncbi:TonB-dependent siderophore myxochelin receptor MxcH [Myxococcus sp. Y35]|uniref:TonB-dependent siderophore myxochelin receptor MxcH n=1 Tax=Pseudomyxococcus flavus TaxID=3115648 RepID=UPI003CF115C7
MGDTGVQEASPESPPAAPAEANSSARPVPSSNDNTEPQQGTTDGVPTVSETDIGAATDSDSEENLLPSYAIDAVEVSAEAESAAERRQKSAEAVQVIETQQLQREAVDLGQALARTQGVGFRRAGGLGSTGRLTLAGLSDDQVRFFIDGVPLEFAGFGPEFANVPVNLVQRMEVYQGVVPTRFGSDALGGAIQLVTADDVEGTRASVSYEYGSFSTHRLTLSGQHLDETRGLFVRANGFFDDTPNNYLVDVQVTDTSGREADARLPRFHDAYRAAGGGVEAGFVNQPWARRLLLRAYASTSAKEIQHDTTMKARYGEVDSGSASAGGTLRFEHVWSSGIVADAVGGYVYRRATLEDLGMCAYDWYGRCVRELPQPGEMESRAIDRNVNQHTAFARINLGWSPAENHDVRLSIAPTWVSRSGEDRALRERGELDPLSGKRDITTLVAGLEYQYDAFDGRLENIAFVKEYIQHLSVDRLLPSNEFTPFRRTNQRPGIGDSLRFRFTPELTGKASYEWATRQPRPDEIFGDGILVSDNLDLVPETSHNVNLGLTLDLPTETTGSFRGSVMGFGRIADQLIVRLGELGYFTYQNVLAARVLGVTGSAGWTSPKQLFALDGNVTWQDIRNRSDGGPFGEFNGQRIPNQPHLLANASARFQLGSVVTPNDELSVAWNTRYVHEFFRAWEDLGQSDTKDVVEAQLLHAVALTYVLRSGGTTLSWTLDVQNLTNARAFDFFGVQRPGRIVSAKWIAEF